MKSSIECHLYYACYIFCSLNDVSRYRHILEKKILMGDIDKQINS